jgi:hypothetical protein
MFRKSFVSHPKCLDCAKRVSDLEDKGRELIGQESSPVTGLEWPREFHEVKVPRFHDNDTGWW